jgi:hypothetical protein
MAMALSDEWSYHQTIKTFCVRGGAVVRERGTAAARVGSRVGLPQ